MNDLVTINNGQPITTSRKIAEKFGKNHKDVLKAVRNLDCSQKFIERNFAPNEFKDSIGRTLSEYIVTRDGFSFLVMGFTGKLAAKFKEEFINQFNLMEKQLKAANPILPDFSNPVEMAREWANQYEKNNLLVETIERQMPDVEYCNDVLKSINRHTTTTIAKELDMTAQKLNKLLHEKGVQYKQDGVWVLYSKHQGKQYTDTRTHLYESSNQTVKSHINTVWTEKGRRFIHDLISQKGKTITLFPSPN